MKKKNTQIVFHIKEKKLVIQVEQHVWQNFLF